MRQAGHHRHGLRVRALILSCGAVGCGSPRHWRSTRPTLTTSAGRCSSATAKATNAAKPGWTRSDSSNSPPGSPTAFRSRPDRCSASSTAPPVGAGGRPPPRATSCASSAIRPGDHLDLFAGNRSQRDHRRGAITPPAHHLRDRRADALTGACGTAARRPGGRRRPVAGLDCRSPRRQTGCGSVTARCSVGDKRSRVRNLNRRRLMLSRLALSGEQQRHSAWLGRAAYGHGLEAHSSRRESGYGRADATAD
jgi:hypothetical protein